MGSIKHEIEQSLEVIAKKRYDEETGLVSISGWRCNLSTETPILFTVLDKTNLSKWTRLIEDTSSKRNTLKVKIPRSAVQHEIVTTAELLRENHSCEKDANTFRRFTVELTSTCVAIGTSENCQLEELISSFQSISTSNSQNGFPRTVSLEIERRSADVAGLRLTKSSRGVVRWLITVEDMRSSDRKNVFLLSADQHITYFEFPISDGVEYYVEAIGLDYSGGNIYCRGSANYITDLPGAYKLDELRQLHQLAVANAGQKSARCRWLYRNRKPEYFRKIFKEFNGIMKPYPKDNSGDPRSPINGRIDGLFFMASVKPGSKKGEPIPDSAFGNTRILVPVEELLAKAPNLYFTDFYCMGGKRHYVTLVMTRPGSKWDKFCANRLLSLSLSDRSSNPFLFCDDSTRRLHVSSKNQLFVELLFTEELDISGYKRKRTRIADNCRGHSKNGGKPKNPDCRICNLPKPL